MSEQNSDMADRLSVDGRAPGLLAAFAGARPPAPAWADAALAQTPEAFSVTVDGAEIEDGVVADTTQGMLAHVARNIAYRAVRNRGTIGGSIAHADPAADWVNCMTVLGATYHLAWSGGRRKVAAADFMKSA